MSSSLLTSRRRWVLAGVAGAMLIGGVAAASGTAFAAQEPTTDPVVAAGTGDDATATDTPISALDAADRALAELPECEVTSVLLYQNDSPVWEVEMTCDGDGTTQYVEIDAEDGSLISINDDYSVGDDADGGSGSGESAVAGNAS